MKKIWVYDLETLDIFTATFLERKTKEIKQFIISKTKDEREELFLFLKNEVAGLIGFNCLFFDSQVLEYLFRNPNATAEEIRIYAVEIIQQEDRFPDIPEWGLKIPHLDLYKINHFDNKNRRTSLKWCEFGLDLENIMDMPSCGIGDNWEEMVLSYNLNDVFATDRLCDITIPMIELRKELKKLYKIPCINWSNTKIGSELLLKLYCEKTNKNPKVVKKLRTYRKEICFNDIIFDYIEFKSDKFKTFLKELKITSVTSTKNAFEYSVVYKDFQFDYGLGGIHGSINNKIVQSNDDYVIIDCDVSSLYPSIAVVNKMYPKHLGPEFYEVYKNEIVDKRLSEKHKKSKGLPYNNAIIEGFKESANATYGNSNNQYSWLYDPEYTLKTTINGQLMLTMLAEQLLELQDIRLIQINTDGLTVLLNRKLISRYYDICKDWMKITNLELEFVNYSKMIIADVNNYIAVYEDINKKPKFKGRFEFENIPLHKNKSHSIIPKAIFEYFINNISVEETLLNHNNIFDFCGAVKGKRGVKFVERYFEDGQIKDKNTQKVNRYIVSNNGVKFIKILDPIKTESGYNKSDKLLRYRKENPNQLDLFHFLPDVSIDKDRENEVEAGYNCILMNSIISKKADDYDINYQYYIDKCNSIIIEMEYLN